MTVPSFDGAAAAAAVLMSPATRSNPVLFVEGNCEVLLLSHHLPQYRERVIPCGGHSGVREAIRTIEVWENKRNQTLSVLGLLDRDYGSNSRYRRITFTNNRDVEVDLYLTEAAERLLREKASRNKCTDPRATISEALDALRTVGIIRMYNSEKKCGWAINGIQIDGCLIANGAFSADKFLGKLCVRNSISQQDMALLKKYIQKNQPKRISAIVRGHDISVLLGKWLRKKIGNRTGSETAMEVLEENLRLSSRWPEITRYHWGRRVQFHLTSG